MSKTLLVNIVGLFIFFQFTLSLANVTEASELHQPSYENQTDGISTILSSTEIPDAVLTTNATIESSTVVTGSPKRKKSRLPQGRPRRQGLGYGSFPVRYGIPTLFEMCPPLATTCPVCTDKGVQVPPGFCDLVVLKVLAISPPQIDDNGRVCGKFGMLKLYGNFNEKDFRRLLRFSVSETCECSVKASGLYFLITPLSTFLKDGLLFNQIVLTERAILISTDRYIEREILEVLNQCPLPEYNHGVSVPYGPPSIPPPAPGSYVVKEPPLQFVPPPAQPPYVPPPAQPPYVPPPAQPPYVPPPAQPPYAPPPAQPPYVPPPAQPSPPYVPLPTQAPPPYVPPPVKPHVPYTPPPYVSPPTEPPVQYPLPPSYNPPPAVHVPSYNPAPAQLPVQTTYQVRPVTALPLPSLPMKQILPPFHSSKLPFVYPSLTKCLGADTCPVCARLDQAGDITEQYCTAGFAYMAVIRVPDASTLQGADTAYSGPTCLNLRTNIVYDITRTRDPTIVVSALIALLPVKCLACFAGLSGPVIVLLMGPTPPVPPSAQFDASFQVYILPVPSTLILPSCVIPYSYGSPIVPYSLVPIAAQPYSTNDCPEASHQTCPLCHNYPDTSFATACASGFAIVTELNLAGPYFTSQRLPSISVKTTTTYYTKSIEVSVASPPPIYCIKGFFKIIQSIGLAPLNFPGEIIPFVSLPHCECLSQGFKRLLIFSSGPLVISDDGVLFLSKDINIAFLQPDAALPTCGVPPPPPTAYVPLQPFYIPPQEVPLSPYARPARVPLTYIPPPPPPPAYTPPSDPGPAYILPPDYLPPPLKESLPLPYSPDIPLLPATPPTHPKLLPETQPPPYTTELPFEETPPPILGCTEFGNGSCVIVDANQDKEAQFSINVDEDLPYEPRFQALNSLIYEDATIWSPSFEECLSSAEPSCPHNLEGTPEKFEEFFCNAKTALLVAVGIDYSILGNETAVSKRLTFIQPELPYIGIDYGIPNNPVSITVTVTPNKTMERRIQLQNNADYCYKEKVLVLSDLSDFLKPKVVVGGLDVYIPGFCDSEIFDKVPSYGVLLSLLQPSDVKNPVQLTEDFTFIPLPEGRLGLPDCGKSPKEKPSIFVEMQSEKFWVPVSSVNRVVCELSEDDNCRDLGTVDDGFFVLPCDVRSAALVLIHNTSAGNSFGPNLEILETAYKTGEKTIVLNVEPNVDEDTYSFIQNQYAHESHRCKYATARVLKDLSHSPLIGEDDLFTIIGNANCDNPIFKKANQVMLLLTDELILPNTVIPLDGRAEVFEIPPGRTTISFCNANPSPDTADEKSSDVANQIAHKSTDFFDQDTLPDKSVTYTKEAPPKVETFEVQEISCKGHEDDSCPVCDDIDSISPDEYCDSGLSFFAEIIEHEIGDEKCTNGIIVSLYDLTVSNGVPVSEVHKISYTIPSHCECPALKKGGHLLLLSDESTLIVDDLSINLSKGKYLYSSPLNATFPPCSIGDSVQARSKDINNIIVLDAPYQELLKITPELSQHVCPTIDHTCPTCKSMNDEELENLICDSEEVLLVSRSKNQKENTRQFSKIGKATFTQHRENGKYILEMNIGKYESRCGLPLAVGNCSESLERYYYASEDEKCSKFSYTGCGGNANNFLSVSDCEKSCFAEDFCEEGVLDIKKIVKSSDNANYLGNKFDYTLPEHCVCPEMSKGDKKGVGYLLSTEVDGLGSYYTQLTRNYYFVPLSKGQRKKQFSCPTDGDTVASSENEISDSEVAVNSDSQTNASTESTKKKYVIGRFWG